MTREDFNGINTDSMFIPAQDLLCLYEPFDGLDTQFTERYRDIMDAFPPDYYDD